MMEVTRLSSLGPFQRAFQSLTSSLRSPSGKRASKPITASSRWKLSSMGQSMMINFKSITNHQHPKTINNQKSKMRMRMRMMAVIVKRRTDQTKTKIKMKMKKIKTALMMSPNVRGRRKMIPMVAAMKMISTSTLTTISMKRWNSMSSAQWKFLRKLWCYLTTLITSGSLNRAKLERSHRAR